VVKTNLRRGDKRKKESEKEGYRKVMRGKEAVCEP
jgi:hypothetical protein